jgi:hypothetical protein
MDPAGHVSFTVSLDLVRSLWSASIIVRTELGQLERLAREARAFVLAAGAAA